MKRIYHYLSISLFAVMLTACAGEAPETPEYVVPEGKRAVSFSLPGVIAQPLTDSPTTRMGNVPGGNKDEVTLEGLVPTNLPDGTTLWVWAKETLDENGNQIEGEEKMLSYVVRDVGGTSKMLYPCTVDSAGNVVEETSVPMFLNVNSTYKFRAVSPARAFVKDTDHALYVNNKEYVIATDERYKQTSSIEMKIEPMEGEGSPVQVVKMNPLINQTAQLEFTIYADANDPNIYSLEVLPQGIEISGIQMQYDKKQNQNALSWNWSLGDTLRAFVGQDDAKFIIRRDDKYKDSFIEKKDNGDLYVHCPILPTDAFSSSIIVLFNLEVNGSPTQYEMMLNQKMYRAAYTYHYKGKVTIEDGIAVITWQYVNWEGEVPVIPRP